MFGRKSLATALLVGISAIGYTQIRSPADPKRTIPHRAGKNNTVLILANSESGLGNVLLATSSALQVNYPELSVHVGSFPKTQKKVSYISKFGQEQNPATQPINFHLLEGAQSYTDAIAAQGFGIEEVIHAPGISYAAALAKDIQAYMVPWSAEEYYKVYEKIMALMDEIDPSVVGIDPLFFPALDATKMQGRNYAVISPNSLKELVGAEQPNAEILWKFPAMGSGYDYPVPWYLIPANIWMNLRMYYSLLTGPDLKEKNRYLKSKGLDAFDDLVSTCTDAPICLTPAIPESDFPIKTIPDNVKAVGPMYLSVASAENQDPELAAWLKNAPTVLINLGSHYTFTADDAKAMAGALKIVFANTNAQVIWKLMKRGNYSDDFLADLEEERTADRLRVVKWLNVDPAAMLETGDVAVSVHHGGANCYFEAIGAGVPHVVLAKWADLYDYAVRAETIGVGVWGNKRSTLDFDAQEIGDALLKTLGNGTAAVLMREKAKEIGKKCQVKRGRDVAAQYVANMARQSPPLVH